MLGDSLGWQRTVGRHVRWWVGRAGYTEVGIGIEAVLVAEDKAVVRAEEHRSVALVAEHRAAAGAVLVLYFLEGKQTSSQPEYK